MQSLYTKTLNIGELVVGKESTELACVVSKGWSGVKKVTIKNIYPQSRVSLSLFIIAKGNETFSFEIDTINAAPETVMQIAIRSLVSDTASVSFRGVARIEKKAHQTSVHVSHHSLLLSDTARAYSLPSMEILHDDVRAGHAVTIGKIDEEQLLYLQSRGLSRDQARDLIVQGFLFSELEKIDSSLRGRVHNDIKKCLTKKK
ncbi:SufD family Fe-S cluster assembly protein [Candidatus Uhrbacteria bacterium]|nr:SufD family Fe-S cluster assembly protein [Candidatus Uhrbacteria bacterium]